MSMNWLRQGVAGVVLAAGFGLTAVGQSVQPVPQLDLSKFTGTWFEIARLPNKQEKKCVGDALVLYGLEDKANHFSVVDTCSLKDDTPQVRNDSGKRPGNSTDGRLETSYFVFLHRQTWVLAVDPGYQWALVGSPNHKELWIYSRVGTMDPAVMAEVQSRATAEGFNASKMAMTPQTNRTKPKEVVKPNGAVAAGVAP